MYGLVCTPFLFTVKMLITIISGIHKHIILNYHYTGDVSINVVVHMFSKYNRARRVGCAR